MTTENEIEFKIEEGKLYLTIPIPTETCDLCGYVEQYTIQPEAIKAFVSHHLPLSFRRNDNWKSIHDYKDNRHVASYQLCFVCAAPIIKARLDWDENEVRIKLDILAKLKKKVK